MNIYGAPLLTNPTTVCQSILDVNKDGKIDSQDAVAAFDQLQEVLSYNLPTGGGFAAGLVMGLRG